MSSSLLQPDCVTERVLVQWREPSSGTPCYLGSADNDLRMTIRLSTQSNSQLLLWFHLPVAVKRHPESKKSRNKSLYFVMQADMFDHSQTPCLSVQSLRDSSPLDSTLVALEASNLGPKDAVSRLNFRLRSNGKVFMPDAKLFPVSENVANTISNLKSLSQARQFDVYVVLKDSYPSATTNEDLPHVLLGALCRKVSAGEMQNNAIDFTRCYSEGMVCDIWSNLDLNEHQNPIGQPPCPAITDTFLTTPAPTNPTEPITNHHQQQHHSLPSAPLDLPPPQYAETLPSNQEDINQEDISTDSSDDLNTLPPAKKRKPNSSSISTENEKPRITKHVRFVSPVSSPVVGWESTLHYLERTSREDRSSSPKRSASRSRSRSGSRTRCSAPPLNHQLADHIFWLWNVDERLPRSTDMLWTLGEAVREGKGEGFGKCVAESMAGVLCTDHEMPSARSIPATFSSWSSAQKLVGQKLGLIDPPSLQKQLAELILWLRSVDYALLAEFDLALWRMGGEVRCERELAFKRVGAAVMAEVFCGYRRSE